MQRMSNLLVPRLTVRLQEAFRSRCVCALMDGAPGVDWSDWPADVHDACGRRVLVWAFDDARAAE